MNNMKRKRIMRYPSQKRYEYFISTVKEQEKVWFLSDEEGAYSFFDDEEGHEFFLVFADKEFADCLNTGDKAVAVDVFDFLELCKPLLEDGKTRFYVMPNGENGYVVEAVTIFYDLFHALAQDAFAPGKDGEE